MRSNVIPHFPDYGCCDYRSCDNSAGILVLLLSLVFIDSKRDRLSVGQLEKTSSVVDFIGSYARLGLIAYPRRNPD